MEQEHDGEEVALVEQGKASLLYPNNLKNWEFGKEGPQNLHSERGAIAERQGPSENANCEVHLTWPKPGSSGCFGIY